MKRLLRYYLMLFLVLSFSRSAYAEKYIVADVPTGDRLELMDKTDVRLIGVDVPEARLNDRAKAQAEKAGLDVGTINNMGKVARLYVKSLVDGKEVLLEFDKLQRDEYGLIAYVYVKAPEGTQLDDYSYGVVVVRNNQKYFFLNALLIDLQYARLKSAPPNVQNDTLLYQINKAAEEREFF